MKLSLHTRLAEIGGFDPHARRPRYWKKSFVSSGLFSVGRGRSKIMGEDLPQEDLSKIVSNLTWDP